MCPGGGSRYHEGMKLLILAVAVLCGGPALADSFVPPDAAAQIDAAVAGAKAARDYCAIDRAGNHRVECHDWIFANAPLVDDAILHAWTQDGNAWTRITSDDIYALQDHGRIGWRGGYFTDAVAEDFDDNAPGKQCEEVVTQDRKKMRPLGVWLAKDSRGNLWTPAAFFRYDYKVPCRNSPAAKKPAPAAKPRDPNLNWEKIYVRREGIRPGDDPYYDYEERWIYVESH